MLVVLGALLAEQPAPPSAAPAARAADAAAPDADVDVGGNAAGADVGEDARVPVAVSVHGAHAGEHAAAIEHRLASSYRIVAAEDALLFIDVEALAEGIVVEVRDATGVISRQEVSMLDEERDVLVWLVVRAALDRAAAAPEAPPVVVPRPASVVAVPAPPAPPAPVRAFVHPSLAALLVASTGDDLAPEVGARVAVALSIGAARLAADIGYRSQRAGSLALHALPMALTVGVGFEHGARFSAGMRVEATPKWLVGHDVALIEVAAGPAVGVALPFGDGPELTVELAGLGKLQRQGFLLDDGAVAESPWRAHLAIGLGWRWG